MTRTPRDWAKANVGTMGGTWPASYQHDDIQAWAGIVIEKYMEEHAKFERVRRMELAKKIWEELKKLCCSDPSKALRAVMVSKKQLMDAVRNTR
jgi:hypothetical protein